MEEENKNLHIIIYSPFPNYSGGRENWLFNVLPYLSNHFNKVFVYSLKSKRAVYYHLDEFSNVFLREVSSISSYGFLFSVINRLSFQYLLLFDAIILYRRSVRKILAKEIVEEDTVLAMNSVLEVLPAIDLKNAGYKIWLISSVRGRVPEEYGAKNPLFRRWFAKQERECLSQCDMVLANGYDTQAYLRDNGISSTVVPNGVDVPKFRNPSAESEELEMLCELKARGTKIILMVATLRKIKGIDNLLEAGLLLKEKGLTNFVIVFVGKGTQYFYKKKAQELGIQNQVLFQGEQKNIAGFLNVADVVVCISGGGGMSMSALEAMATGKPVVAWDTPVYRQLLVHMKDGYLVRYPDVARLAEAIKTLLENPELGKMISENARQKAVQYDWPIVAVKLLEHLSISN